MLADWASEALFAQQHIRLNLSRAGQRHNTAAQYTFKIWKIARDYA
jgi:hypothetical protein